ncbi:uncharacterized protein ISCGN_015811 [Ixodes scapularis]
MDATELEPTASTCVGTSAAEATFDTESMHYADEFHQAEDPNEGWITPRKSRNQRTLPRQVNELHTVVVPIPHSLQLQDIKRYDLLPFFLAAASLPPHASEEVNIDVRLEQRVILLKTAFESSARRLSQTKRIRVRNQLHEISPYLAAPINSCKGVIHGVEAGLTTNDLMHSLESFQTTIITARMMGDTESVLITFEGANVPRTILFRRATYRCHPHRPRALRCEKCRMYGHRTFNCPESPTFWRCPTCAAQIPHQQASHACSPRCYHCGGEHSSFDSTCPVQRQKDQASMKAAYEHRVHLRKTLPRNMQKPPAYPVQTANKKQSAAQHKTELSSSNSYQPPSLNKYHLEAQAQLKASLRNAQKPTESQTRRGMLPATATWGHASAGFSTTPRSPSSQTEDLPQQRSLLYPADLTTSQPKSDIVSQEPKTTRANLTEPAPSPPSIGAPAPSLTPSPCKRSPALTSLTPPVYDSPNYQRHMEHELIMLKERLTPCEEQIAQLTERIANIETLVSNILGTVNPLVSRIEELTKAVASLEKAVGPQPPPAPTLDKHLALQGSTDLIQALQNLYIPPALTSNYPSYSGPENPTSDSPFTLADLDLALAKNSRNSAPGEDTITYCLLRNLPEANKKQLLTYINEHWSEGTYPKEWKSSTIIMIPKPGKPPSLNNLRPISLTSCVGKTMERMVLDRFQEHLEATAFLPHTQIGFRSHVSTQDLFLLLQHTFLSPSSCQVHALVTVDVRKAFDNISHDHILASVRETECGQNLYTYIQNFLKDRTACFRIGGELSQPLSLTRGTPQGAVLSPTLFNLGMAQLARCLQQILHLSHIFYADDLTLWCTHGSPGEVESTLQKGLDTITAFLTQAGLKPAPEKSELLLLSQTQYQRSVNHLISLYLDHQTIPRVSLCKVLGIHLHDRSNQANITPAINTCHSVTHLVRRVVQRRAGLNEKQASQLVHALALSKILYSVPYFTLTRQQLNKLSSALSTLYKASLNLPIHTSTQRLYETGLFLPLSSLLHLHRDRQLARLSGSHQGRWILEQAGLSPIDFYLHLPASPLPSNLRFALLPRRMAPGLDDGRRDAQALHHNPPFQTQTVAYTDASILDTGTAAYAIYIPKHSLPILHTCGPYSDPPSITTLELVPIIHAIISFSQLPRTSAYTVYSDSMAAIRSLQQRQIPADLREDLEMALHSLSSSSVTIRWVPGHAGIAGNELVHQLAREFHSRAPAIPWLSPPTNDEAAEYKKTLKLHYKQIRISHELLPRPHPQLSVAQTHILRKIQTNTLVTPARLYLFRYRSDPSCPNCPAPYANQEHCLLHCPVAYTTSFLPNPPPPSWSAWLASPQLEDQLALVLQAEDILGT